ncbi:hypothetical protein GXW82_44015 [Streptacidiphilus sp. 4-A2]|nr:hypothetical protein [Streptacidiphilus sp. 4-A2]
MEQRVPPAAVSRDEVELLLVRSPAFPWDVDIASRWDDWLRSLGHDPETTGSDPVAEHWAALRAHRDSDNGESGDPEHTAMERWGYGFLDGIEYVLSRHMALDF